MAAAMRHLPYGRQCIDEADIAAVAAVLRSDYLTTGPAVAAFATRLCEITEAPHAIACANGTAALHLACAALGLGDGDAVVVPSITFLATANAPRMTGAEVVFADVDPDTGLMQPDHFSEALARADAAGLRVRAVLPVHLAGQCADLPSLGEIARARGIAVIEDACHALGGAYARGGQGWAPVGACLDGDMAIFSFHPVKNATTGEGGAVTTRDPALAARLDRLRCHGMVREPALFRQPEMAFSDEGPANPWYYEMPELGWNYRLTDIQAALGLSQLGKLRRFLAERQRLAALYDAALAPLAPLVRPISQSRGCRSGWHLYPVLIDFTRCRTDRAELMRRLRARGVGTQVHYIPVHRQPYYRDRYGLADLPGADAYYARTLSLPLFVGMSDEDVAYVCDELAEAVAGVAEAAA
ncbi:MAG TPA: UDP-4-amino-4,6-dideoxy-N-acetyl-beta-L-altrosamine transaminase [Stellaceae bacterium]|nr:UDP-4-amino-4,6-dideoxy-N-acetyl-beta-L-altrosamine transaminase [Stellaceae bacterium]